MQETTEHSTRQALAARQKAEACMDNQVREQWLAIAKMWDDLVRAFEEVRRERESALLDD